MMGAEGLDMFGYVLGGAIIGGLSGGMANLVAPGGGFMATTSSIIFSSTTNSMGMSVLSNGQTNLNISYGFGNYNASTGEFGYLGKQGNSAMENVGYSFGALGNLSDVLAGWNPGEVQLNTDKSDWIGHSAITKVGETDPNNSLVSVGPNTTGPWIFNPFKFKGGTNKWKNYVDAGDDVWKTTVKGINVQRIEDYADYLNGGVKYNLYFSSCVNHTARALTLAGAPSIGIHPFLLHSQIALRSIGIRPVLFSYHLFNFSL
jgi:hypothetical protein